MKTTQARIADQDDRPRDSAAWFAHWFCHCSVLAATRADCPDRCPEHDRAPMRPPEPIEVPPGHLPFGHYPDLTASGEESRP